MRKQIKKESELFSFLKAMVIAILFTASLGFMYFAGSFDTLSKVSDEILRSDSFDLTMEQFQIILNLSFFASQMELILWISSLVLFMASLGLLYNYWFGELKLKQRRRINVHPRRR